jgi:Trk K+ transport system NAD-binding subunit
MIRLPNSSLILSVLRDGETYTPGGDFILHEKDTVIVICTLQSLSKIEDLFTGNE